MNKIIFFLISLMIGLMLFGLITSRVGFLEIVEAFYLFSWQGLVVILALTFFIGLIDIWKLKFILRTQGYKLSYSKTAEVLLPGFAFSYLTPFAIWGGEFIMIYILKKKFDVIWEKGGASILIFRIIDATIFFPFLILGILIFPILTGHLPVGKVLTFGGIITGIFVVLLINFYIKSFKGQSVLEGLLKIFGKDRRKMEETENGRMFLNGEKEVIKFFNPRKKEMWLAAGNSVAKYFLILIRAWFLIFFFQGGSSILKALVAYGFFNLSCLVPIPAQLGALEASEAMVFQGFGLGANIGIAFALVLRAMDSLGCLIGIIIAIKIGFSLIRKKIVETINGFGNFINRNNAKSRLNNQSKQKNI